MILNGPLVIKMLKGFLIVKETPTLDRIEEALISAQALGIIYLLISQPKEKRESKARFEKHRQAIEASKPRNAEINTLEIGNSCFINYNYQDAETGRFAVERPLEKKRIKRG